MIETSRSGHILGEVDREPAMNSPRRLALLALATLLTALVLANVALTLKNSGLEDQARTGIEREGDIPLPIAFS
jgi:hypothetical protein